MSHDDLIPNFFLIIYCSTTFRDIPLSSMASPLLRMISLFLPSLGRTPSFISPIPCVSILGMRPLFCHFTFELWIAKYLMFHLPPYFSTCNLLTSIFGSPGKSLLCTMIINVLLSSFILSRPRFICCKLSTLH